MEQVGEGRSLLGERHQRSPKGERIRVRLEGEGLAWRE